MKQRMGLVSNSSSSSFIVAFPKFPESALEVRQLLFGKSMIFKSPFNDHVWYNALDVAETVYKDCDKGEINHDRILSIIARGYFDGQPEYPSYSDALLDEDWHQGWREWEGLNDTAAQLLRDKLVGENEDAVFFAFEYCDNDSEYYSALEHGGLFRALPHIRISHH